MSRQLTIACGDYDRTHALVEGTVKAEGLELNWLDLPHLEIWTRMLNFYDFDASEMSLASYVIAKTLDKPSSPYPYFRAELSGIPIFSSTRTVASGRRATSWAKEWGWENSSKPRRSGSEAFCNKSMASI